jgi:flagellar assembly protein FliH
MAPSKASTYIPQAFDPAAIRVALNPAEAAEQARLLAFEKGYNDGLEQARRDVELATEEANKAVRRSLAALAQAADGFDERQALAIADVEDAIVAAAFEIARAVVQHELNAMTEPGAEAIARAMQLAPTRGELYVRMNPQDVETLNTTNFSSTTREVHIVPDQTIELGGCIVDAGETQIDARFSAVFANVRTALGLPESAVAGSNSSDSRTTAQEAPLP